MACILCWDLEGSPCFCWHHPTRLETNSTAVGSKLIELTWYRVFAILIVSITLWASPNLICALYQEIRRLVPCHVGHCPPLWCLHSVLINSGPQPNSVGIFFNGFIIFILRKTICNDKANLELQYWCGFIYPSAVSDPNFHWGGRGDRD